MTTTPSMLPVPSTSRIASTAAWSAPSLSPRPTIRAAARAAASVVRTSSRARLRSGCEGCTLMAPQPMWRRLDRARRLARALELRCAHGRPEEHQARADQSEEPPVLERDLAARRARLADDALVEDQHSGGDADDRGQLPARPRERGPAGGDVGEDERRDRGGEQQPAQDRVDVPRRQRAALTVDVREAVAARPVPRQEQRDAEQQAAGDGDPLVLADLLRRVHGRRTLSDALG